MTLSTTNHPVFGMSLSAKDDLASLESNRVSDAPVSEDGPGDFERLVGIYQGNQFLFRELKSLKEKIARTEAYLQASHRSLLLGETHLKSLRTKQTAVLRVLRVNRVEARDMLERLDAGEVASSLG